MPLTCPACCSISTPRCVQLKRNQYVFSLRSNLVSFKFMIYAFFFYKRTFAPKKQKCATSLLFFFLARQRKVHVSSLRQSCIFAVNTCIFRCTPPSWAPDRTLSHVSAQMLTRKQFWQRWPSTRPKESLSFPCRWSDGLWWRMAWRPTSKVRVSSDRFGSTACSGCFFFPDALRMSDGRASNRDRPQKSSSLAFWNIDDRNGVWVSVYAAFDDDLSECGPRIKSEEMLLLVLLHRSSSARHLALRCLLHLGHVISSFGRISIKLPSLSLRTATGLGSVLFFFGWDISVI